MTTRHGEHEAQVPALLVERLALGELDAAQADAVRRRLEEAGEAWRLEALRESDQAILAAHPAAAMAREIARRQARPVEVPAAEAWWRRGWTLAFPALAAAALMVVLLPSAGAPDAGPTGGASPGVTLTPATRAKGLLPHLQVFRRRGAAEEQLEEGAGVRAADLIQLKYVAAGARFGAIVSVDGRGALTRHYPEAGSAAGALDGDGAEALPHAYELDDAPGFERFVFVGAERPFEVAVVEAAARALAERGAEARTAPLDLPAGLAQSSFTLTKVEAP